MVVLRQVRVHGNQPPDSVNTIADGLIANSSKFAAFGAHAQIVKFDRRRIVAASAIQIHVKPTV